MIQNLYIYILIIVGLETTAMSCFKHSLIDKRFFALGVLFYGCVGFMLCQTFLLTGLAMTNAIWSALSVISTTTVGVMLYKEMLHMHDYLAIAMIASGVLILNFTR
jgi:multidrug transporter EmrE-like cation transporter